MDQKKWLQYDEALAKIRELEERIETIKKEFQEQEFKTYLKHIQEIKELTHGNETNNESDS